MSIEKAKAGILRLKSEVPVISTVEDVDALDGVVELVLLHLERSSQQVSSGLESLLADVAIASAVRGQVDIGFTKKLH